MHKYFQNIGDTDYISEWESKGISHEIIRTPATTNNILALALSYVTTKTTVKFNGSCLKQDKTTFTRWKTVNIYINYERDLLNYVESSDPTLEHILFGAVKLVKNADIDKYQYSGYYVGFDMKGIFSFHTGAFSKNVIVFGVDMTFSRHFDNKKKCIVILDERPTQGLDDSTLTTEKKHSINFTGHKRNFV